MEKNKSTQGEDQEFNEKIKRLQDTYHLIVQCRELMSQYKERPNQEDEQAEQLYLQLQNAIKILPNSLQRIVLEYVETLRAGTASSDSSYTYRTDTSILFEDDNESSQESLSSSDVEIAQELPDDAPDSKWIALFKNNLVDLAVASTVEEKILVYPLLYKLSLYTTKF